jgi:ABC-type transport system substrate-binding protein
MISRKRYLIAVALLVLSVIAPGCGPAEEGPSEDAGGPIYGGTAIYVMGADAESLDPPNMTQMTSELVARLIHDGLVAFSPTIEIIPGLAESWEISDDGLTYTFHLRPDVKFQDGTPCDAEAVKYCIDRMVNEETMKSGLHRGLVESTRAVDETTLEIVLFEPFATYLNNLAHAASMIYSPTAHKQYGDDLTLHPVGTGPYKLAEWKKGDEVILERWNDSWRGKPYLDQITFKVVPEDSSRALMLESGDAHLMAFVPPEIAERLEENEGIVVEQYQSARVLGLSLNNQWGPFQDVRVRQALNYAIDKDSIVQNIYQGHAKASGGPSGPLITGSYEVPPYPYDPAKAKELLAEAGYPDGFEVTLLSPKGRFLKDAELMQEVQKQLGEVGLEVNLELMEYAAFSAAMHKAQDETDVQMFLQGWVPSTGEARWTMYAMFDCDMWVPTGSNGSFYCNPKMDELVANASSAPSLEVRDEYLKQAQQLAHDDAVWVYLLATPQIAARSVKLHEPWLSAFEFVTLSEKSWLEE